MAKKCPICGKESAMVGKRNLLRGKYNPTKKTRKYPNLQWAALPACADLPSGGRVKICTSCLKKGLSIKQANLHLKSKIK